MSWPNGKAGNPEGARNDAAATQNRIAPGSNSRGQNGPMRPQNARGSAALRGPTEGFRGGVAGPSENLATKSARRHTGGAPTQRETSRGRGKRQGAAALETQNSHTRRTERNKHSPHHGGGQAASTPATAKGARERPLGSSATSCGGLTRDLQPDARAKREPHRQSHRAGAA